MCKHLQKCKKEHQSNNKYGDNDEKDYKEDNDTDNNDNN